MATKQKKTTEFTELPLLPVRDTVLFPNAILPLTVGRESSLKLISELKDEEKFIGVVAQRDPRVDNPQAVDLYQIGTVAFIHKIIKLPSQSLFIFVEGLQRIAIQEVIQVDPYIRARVKAISDETAAAKLPDFEALVRSVTSLFQQVVQLSPTLSDDLQTVVMNIDDPGRLTDFIAANLPSLSSTEKQELLESFDLKMRLERLNKHLAREVEVQQLRSKIQSDVQDQVTQTQREYYLREQMKAIQKELGEVDEQQEIEELRRKIEAAGMSEEARKEATRELGRLAKMSPAAADYHVTRTYLDWLVALPWTKISDLRVDLRKAKETLDADHFDLEKIKERILDYLAVLQLKPQIKGPIICFAGPPGVGKTSLGKSIARALDRKFVRMSLGGIHDEAEIRGHRRTYIGALPGNIIQGIRKAGSRNCVMMLDEIDKLGAGIHGDPGAALLEVLDPEQNNTFRDNYLGVPFDLSRVAFITTANMLDTVPGPLRDRMEIISLAGYTADEKLEIAHRYLVRRQMEANGLKPGQVEIDDEAIGDIIRNYTREAGVRSLERLIGQVLRNAAVRIAEGDSGPIRITRADLVPILGAPKFESETAMRTSVPGVATGLAWTPVGGDILFIEATRIPGSGKLILTGQLGDVMKESAQAALSIVKNRAAALGIDSSRFEKSDIHVHVPAGATPKDGPSAGVAMFMALVSLMTERTIRSDTAMTGEISLRGLVLPVGGIKEKVLAAHAAGIRRVMLPARNRRDYDDIPEIARKEMVFIWLERVEQAVAAALEPKKSADGAPAAAPQLADAEA